MVVVRYRIDEHNIVYNKLKKMQKELKDLLDCVEDKMAYSEEEYPQEEEEDEEVEFRRSMRGNFRSEPFPVHRRGGRYGYRM